VRSKISLNILMEGRPVGNTINLQQLSLCTIILGQGFSIQFVAVATKQGKSATL